VIQWGEGQEQASFDCFLLINFTGCTFHCFVFL